MAEFCAAPQSTDPTSKMNRAARNVHFRLKKRKAFPNGSWKAGGQVVSEPKTPQPSDVIMYDIPHFVSRYEDPYHPTCWSAWNWSVMRGMAVAMMVLSNATQKREMKSAKRVTARVTPVG